MLLQDVKDIKKGRIISGQRELTLDSKTKDDREPDQSDIEAAQRGNNMVGMSVADLNDLVRLMEGKPTFAAKVTVIAAKQMIAAKKRMGAGDFKSTKDQIAELESQKEEAKKKGYGTDAYDAKIKNLQKDSVEIKASLASQTWVVSKDGEFIKRFNSYEEAYNFAKTIGYSGYGDSADESDVFTQDPLTEKGKEILASMKEQYGEEKGEQVFYASKNKGTISGVDSYDLTQPRNIAAAKKLSVAQGKAATGDAPAPKEFDYLKDWQNAAMERGYRLQNSLQRGMWIAYQGNREMGTFVRTRGGKLYLDSKTKDASRSEQAYDEGYEAALQGKPFTANPYKDVSRSGYADLKESWEDGYRDCRSGKSSKDSKTKDEGHTVQYNGWKINLVNRGSHWEGEAFHNENMRKKMLSSEGSDFSRVKQDLMNQIDMQTNDSKTKDSDIIINVVENPNEEVESEEEAFDLVHYNGYNIKLVKETGEYDIYDVGGAMIGHTATLELAKLFVDNKGNATIVYE